MKRCLPHAFFFGCYLSVIVVIFGGPLIQRKDQEAGTTLSPSPISQPPQYVKEPFHRPQGGQCVMAMRMSYITLNTNELLANITGQNQALALMERYESLTALARADDQELMQVPGVGAAKAAALKSALTLAIKLSQEITAEPPLLDSPDKIADLLREELRLQTTETFIVVMLNTRRKLIKYVRISNGTLDTLLVHPREVFKVAIAANAAAIVVAHNHPSSDPTASEADIKVTRDLIRAGQLLKIELVDHVIIGAKTTERQKDYVSLREQGYFYA